jgi:hypothetical protein
MDLTRDLIGLQARANEIVGEEFGRDPFRGALLAQGAVPTGRSPHGAFLQRLRTLGQQDLGAPLTGEESLPVIQERIGELEEKALPGLPRAPLGMAHGGIVRRRPLLGHDSASANLQPGRAVLVGEGVNGEGIRNQTAEVAEFMPDGSVRFIPLRGAAQEGGIVDIDAPDPFAGVSLESEQVARIIQPLFGALGMTDIPIGTRAAFGQFEEPVFGEFGGGLPRQDPSRAAETFSRLGTRPRVLQAAGRNEFFFRTPEGELQKIGGLAELNALRISPQDVAVMPFEQILEEGQFAGQRRTEPEAFTDRGPFAARSSPIFVPLGVDEAGLPDARGPGIFLPAPRKLVAIWRQLDPETQDVAQSLYRLAGVSDAQFNRELGFFTPGGARTPAPAGLG